MTLLPIVERELRVASRRGETYWGRFSAGATAIGFAMWGFFFSSGWMSPAMIGQNAFRWLLFLAVIAVLVTSLRLTCDTISREKREGTLGFLFLTDLRPYDVIFGKLAYPLTVVVYQCLAAVPAFALPLLVGGVGWSEIGWLVLGLLNLGFYCTSAAMLTSTLCRREKDAVGMAGLLVLGTLVFPFVVVGFLNAVLPGILPWLWVLKFSAAVPLIGLFLPGGMRTMPVGSSLLITHLMAWAWLGLSCWLLPRVWQDRPLAGGSQVRRRRWRTFWLDEVKLRLALRTELLPINPIAWLVERAEPGRWGPWLSLGVVGVAMLAVSLKWPVPWLECGVVLPIVWTLNVAFKFSLASHASRAFSADRDAGALELLLSTPLKESEMIEGAWLSLRRRFFKPVVALMFLEAVWITMALCLGEASGWPRESWAVVLVACWILLPADLVALGWMGMWKSVTERTATQAASAAQGRILVMPYLVVLLVTIVAGSFRLFRPDPMFLLLLLLGASAYINWKTITTTRAALLTQLRSAALHRAIGEPQPSHGWQRLGRALGRWWGRVLGGSAEKAV